MENEIGSMVTISSDGITPLHTNLDAQKQVSVQMKYPKDYKGTKWFADGHIEHAMALDSAKMLVEAGIGTILEDAIPGEGPATPAAVPYNKMKKADLHLLLTDRGIEYDEKETNAELVELLDMDDAERDQQ